MSCLIITGGPKSRWNGWFISPICKTGSRELHYIKLHPGSCTLSNCKQFYWMSVKHIDFYLQLGIVFSQVGVVVPAGLCAEVKDLLGGWVVVAHESLSPCLCHRIIPRHPLGFQSCAHADESQQHHCPVHNGLQLRREEWEKCRNQSSRRSRLHTLTAGCSRQVDVSYLCPSLPLPPVNQAQNNHSRLF